MLASGITLTHKQRRLASAAVQRLARRVFVFTSRFQAASREYGAYREACGVGAMVSGHPPPDVCCRQCLLHSVGHTAYWGDRLTMPERLPSARM